MTAVIPLHPEGSLSLVLAVIASSSAPIVLLDGNLCVIAASASFYDAFLIDSETLQPNSSRNSAMANGTSRSYQFCLRQPQPVWRTSVVTRWI